MNNKIIKILTNPTAQLVFSLFSGSAYFIVFCVFVWEFTRNTALILFYLAPLIICGGALIIIKLIKQGIENENHKIVLRIFWLHFVLILMAVIFAVSMFS